jgi:hypothetical protein
MRTTKPIKIRCDLDILKVGVFKDIPAENYEPATIRWLKPGDIIYTDDVPKIVRVPPYFFSGQYIRVELGGLNYQKVYIKKNGYRPGWIAVGVTEGV